MITPNETSNGKFFGGNDTNSHRPMWLIARDYNRKSVELYGQVTSVCRHKVESTRRILG